MDKPIKLTSGQWAVLRWLKAKPGTPMPHTTNQPYCQAWQEWKPASVPAFYSLERRGLIERRNTHFWHLTKDGEALASGFVNFADIEPAKIGKSKPAITLKLWVSESGYQVELQDHISLAPEVWEWSGCQDWSCNHDVKQAAVLLSMDIRKAIKTFEKRHTT